MKGDLISSTTSSLITFMAEGYFKERKTIVNGVVNGIDLDRFGDFYRVQSELRAWKGTDIVYNLHLFRFSPLPPPPLHPFPPPSSWNSKPDPDAIYFNLLNPLALKSDQHLISPFSNAAGSFIKIMRIKKMIANPRTFDYYTNSPCQYQTTSIEKCMENIDTDVRV